MKIGANFCHVIKIKHFNQVNPSITIINQDWKGAAPSFNDRAIVKRILIKLGIRIFENIEV